MMQHIPEEVRGSGCNSFLSQGSAVDMLIVLRHYSKISQLCLAVLLQSFFMNTYIFFLLLLFYPEFRRLLQISTSKNGLYFFLGCNELTFVMRRNSFPLKWVF